MAIDEMFKNAKANFEKLKNFGFEKDGKVFKKCVEILNGQFNINVFVDKNGVIKTKLFDASTNEEYVLHLMEGTSGAFVGKVREEFFLELEKIKINCFDNIVFKLKQTSQIEAFAKEKFGSELEFLWPKFPEDAILRRKDNRKWYAVFMKIRADKIGLPKEEFVEVVDLRIDPAEIENVVDGKKVFYGYHMNKKHWITICLDGSVKLDELKKFIEKSYIIAGQKK